MINRMKKRRRSRATNLLAVVLIIVNVIVGKGWPYYCSLLVPWYFVFFVGYAYRKTGICPMEIMVRSPVWRWHRAFTLMYKELAVRMELIYFMGVLLVGLKGIYLGILVLRLVRSRIE